jgi:hypothetical protein
MYACLVADCRDKDAARNMAPGLGKLTVLREACQSQVEKLRSAGKLAAKLLESRLEVSHEKRSVLVEAIAATLVGGAIGKGACVGYRW